MAPKNSTRPRLTKTIAAAEFQRWYWLKTELIDFARELEIRTTGSKLILTDRIIAHFNGDILIEPALPHISN